MLKSLYKLIVPKSIRLSIWYRKAYRGGIASKNTFHPEIEENWRKRIDTTLSSPDNFEIPRHPNSGCVEDFYITMHNGVKVAKSSYYGEGAAKLLIENKGVHEPQEERVFEEIIKTLPQKCRMLELGSYWAFYSLSLLNKRPLAKCYMVEPLQQNIIAGKVNFKLNRRKGSFFRAFVDKTPDKNGPTISVDSFCKSRNISHLDILHSDIQGYELRMLRGAEKMLNEKRIDFVFISTHSNELHRECISELEEKHYSILASADIDETYSFDGLIVAKRDEIDYQLPFSISKRKSG